MKGTKPPLDALLESIRVCRICRDDPLYGEELPHEPRPVLQASSTARICIAGQAPGTRVHQSGVPFDDPSGIRLRQWMNIGEDVFYDKAKVAIIPMGFCFPGLRADGSDMPPRRECAEIWRGKVFSLMPEIKVLLVVGGHAQRWHLGPAAERNGVDSTVRGWREVHSSDPALRIFPLPHPSWHNTRWIKRNPWFERELLPELRESVRKALG